MGLNIEVNGKRPKHRPEQRCLDILASNLKASKLHPNEAYDGAK